MCEVFEVLVLAKNVGVPGGTSRLFASVQDLMEFSSSLRVILPGRLMMNGRLQKVTLVDDDPLIREIAGVALETVGGLEVSLLPSGQALLDSLGETLPELIVLDINMPGLDGPRTLELMTEQMGSSRPAVVFFSAYCTRKEKGRLMELGAAAVLEKPFDPMTLASKLQEIWEELGGKPR